MSEYSEFLMNKSVHSDFLIHWTGIEIDRECDNKWWKTKSSKPNRIIIEPYLERLKYILKYGLWMNEGEDCIKIKRDGKTKRIKIPKVARTCFTELKLSEIRFHAKRFGRLGIGFKRMFVFNRLGSPMIYYRPEKDNWSLPPYLHLRKEKYIDDYSSCFLKSMDETSRSGELLGYKQFDESEWRIIYSEVIEKNLNDLERVDICKFFKKPSKIKDPKFQAYAQRYDENNKLRFLIPLKAKEYGIDKWFAMIIYPNLAVKVEAEANPEIRRLIGRLKPKKPTTVVLRESAGYEKYSKPIELDLDASRNF